MAPAATETSVLAPAEAGRTPGEANPSLKGSDLQNQLPDHQLLGVRTDNKEPLKLSGALDKYEHFDVTPVIGREFVDVNLVELLRAPDSDELIRDLAITSKPD